ncbi:R1 [Scenedesmus sp. PABB004]|nr:R1 [Scenedesmus sp. PABB004]
MHPRLPAATPLVWTGRRAAVKQRCSASGVELSPAADGTRLYPSGRVAVTACRSGGGAFHTFFADTDDAQVLAAFDPDGVGSVGSGVSRAPGTEAAAIAAARSCAVTAELVVECAGRQHITATFTAAAGRPSERFSVGQFRRRSAPLTRDVAAIRARMASSGSVYVLPSPHRTATPQPGLGNLRRRKLLLLSVRQLDELLGPGGPRDTLLAVAVLASWNPVSMRLEHRELQEAMYELHRAQQQQAQRAGTAYVVGGAGGGSGVCGGSGGGLASCLERAGADVARIQGNRVQALVMHRAAERLGLQLIGLDRPGYGDSTPLPGRRVTDYAADLAEVADQLGLSRFSCLASSAGTMYALAAARADETRDRIAGKVTLLSPWVPRSCREPGAPAGALSLVATWAPLPLLRAAVGWSNSWVARQARARPVVELMTRSSPAERAAFAANPDGERVYRAMIGEWGPSLRGIVDDMALCVERDGPLGFSYAHDVPAHVRVYAGTADAVQPHGDVAAWAAAAGRGVELVSVPDGTHDGLLHTHAGAALAALAADLGLPPAAAAGAAGPPGMQLGRSDRCAASHGAARLPGAPAGCVLRLPGGRARRGAASAASRPGLPRGTGRHGPAPGLGGRAGRVGLRVQAVAATERPAKVVEQTFDLPRGSSIKVTVMADSEGQEIELRTDVEAGRLLLHWGVEGGKDYKAGWRLPGAKFRPEGTQQYKDRALQTPFKNGVVRIRLAGDEASDVINFVLKDDATNTWYDHLGSNFAVPLRPAKAAGGGAPPAQLPQALCDTWAWIRWDHAGRPHRSEAQADEEYERAVAEMAALIAGGRPLSELQRVASGEMMYSNYRMDVIDPLLGLQALDATVTVPVASRDFPEADAAVVIPDSLVAVQAFVMWEQAGKPQGADFGSAARKKIEDKLRSGQTLDEIEWRLKHPGQEPPSKQDLAQARVKQAEAKAAEAEAKAAAKAKEAKAKGAEAKAAAPPPPPAPVAPPPPPPVEVGQSMGTAKRDPLAMIKKSVAPELSKEKRERKAKPLEFLVQKAAVDPGTKWRRVFQLGSKSELLCVVRQPEGLDGPTHISLISDNANDLVLHWGVSKPGSRDWRRAAPALRPEDTVALEGGTACETDFLECEDDECDVEIAGSKVPLQRITITVPPGSADVGGITFVLRSADQTRWYRDANGNFFIPIPTKRDEAALDAADPMAAFTNDLQRTIAEVEINTFHWTLMHRYHKAADIINEVLDGFFEVDTTEAMADIYVWLRYSASRQLTWQRNYNTQPRILSAAQARLTHTIAAAHGKTSGEAQEWARLMLSCVGRGGDGQRIRDEILHIMHRNHIPEKKGTWMEEWHQKLHNNTTPDDVPICSAYLAFLEANGDRGAYWRVLSDAGITRERLESFDRPIVCEPEWFGSGKKEPLIREFRNYLGILKAVHSGADLQASAAAVGNCLPGGARGYLGYVTTHINSPQILPFLEAAVEARTEIAPSLAGNRDLLYLDVALENSIRGAAERGVGSAGFGAAAFMGPLLQNLCLSQGNNEEACFCLKAWNSLPGSVRSGGRPSREEALQAVAVLNRVRRLLSETSDRIVSTIGPFATAIGNAAKCDPWAVEIFAEEVVRGGPAFAISLVLSAIEPSLRQTAELGAWQVISPHEVMGLVEVVDHLSAVQDKVYDEPTVLVVHNVTGEEEIPEGVVGLLTPDAPDVLSHVSVRARNMHVLFATCHEEEPLKTIKDAAGQYLRFKPTAAGAVTWVSPSLQSIDAFTGAVLAGESTAGAHQVLNLTIDIPRWCGKWVVPMSGFEAGVVGAKSKNLANLRGKIPDWIRLPAAVTVPFGSFEQALELPENHGIRDELRSTVAALRSLPRSAVLAPPPPPGAASGNGNGNGRAAAPPPDGPAALLARCRDLAMQIQVPSELRSQLSAALSDAGIPPPEDEARWGAALAALRGVWASKYNDRAFYSLRKCGIEADDVRMAVCVMRVVPARYAFVIHTKNPSNNDANEVFCELVKGLGESLVSGMVPGSSIAFAARKDNLDHPETLAYASKSEGMFVRDSLIFRSDSNGEDLEGYAGAGLYESITMDETTLVRVDYNDDPITADAEFRRKVFSDICKVGAAIEAALGSAQDIEGVVDPDGNIHVVQTRPQLPSLLRAAAPVATRALPVAAAAFSSGSGRSESSWSRPAAWGAVGLAGGAAALAASGGAAQADAAPAAAAPPADPYVLPAATGSLPKSITLYQYEVCPFCCKVKAFLDYHKLPYATVEVNPLTKGELAWSSYRKVPVIRLDGGEVVVDSSAIISRLAAELRAVEGKAGGKGWFGGKGGKGAEADAEEEARWRRWVDERFVKVLTANIYRSWDESWGTFDYMTRQSHWSWPVQQGVRLAGAVLMWQVGQRMPKKYGLTGDLRETLYADADAWVAALRGRPFLGGAAPNLGDLAVFGVLSALRGTPTYNDLVLHSGIGPARAMAAADIDPYEVAAKLFRDQPPGFPYEGFIKEELILPDGDDMGIKSDDGEDDEEELETETGFGSVIVVDCLPVVPEDKYEKLTNVLRKIYSQIGNVREGGIFMPKDGKGMSKGFAFVEFFSPQEAQAARAQTDGYQLDKSHVFKVSMFDDFDRYGKVPDEYAPPEAKDYTPAEGLHSWMLDKNARDQFVIKYADEVAVMWNDGRRCRADEAYKRTFWTESFVQWSPRGNMLATMHRQGVAVWGGPGFARLQRYGHANVQLVEFSPGERYLMTYSSIEPHNPRDKVQILLNVFDSRSGKKLRVFSGNMDDYAVGSSAGPGGALRWPLFKWAGGDADKYFARLTKGAIKIYETPDMGLLDKKDLKLEGVQDFEWSPSEPLLAAYTAEVGDRPANITVIRIPERTPVRSKQLFNVSDVKIYWHPQGDYMAVQVGRFTKTKKSTYTGFELFSIHEQDIPLDVLELPNKADKVLSFAWEPRGHRFALVHGDTGRPNVSFYTMKDDKGKLGVKLLGTLTNKAVNGIHWSPNGHNIVLSGLRALNGQLEFFNVDEFEILAAAEHFMATDVEWDPTGRYVASAVTSVHQMENGFNMWSFNGKLLYTLPKDRFMQLSWRPRVPSLLPKEKEEEIKKNLKEYSRRYDEEDEALLLQADADVLQERAKQQEEWDASVAARAAYVQSLRAFYEATYGPRAAEKEFVMTTATVEQELLQEQMAATMRAAAAAQRGSVLASRAPRRGRLQVVASQVEGSAVSVFPTHIPVIRKMQDDLLKRKGVASWPTWGAEVGSFDWSYAENEDAYFLAGRVVVTPEGGEPVELAAGDFATFPAGMTCVWDVKEAVRKHYRFH